DGYLYIGLGDGGSANDPEYNGLDRSTLLGALLRIDVDTDDLYGIPADNPFVGDEAARDEIWAYGLRNPWRISFDSETGDLFTGDVGQNKWEEINWQSADSSGGANYGWNAWEATHCFTDECELFTDTVMPIIEYDHSQGCSVTGGYVYRGTQSPALTGNYVYADFCSGNIWGAVSAESEWQTGLLAESGLLISSFGVDVHNELYVLDYNGVVYRVSAE
ncbi:MAG: PQQ-dependent sugar dehydrogenase, partial [Candidatus Promineifilaceae bacterium]